MNRTAQEASVTQYAFELSEEIRDTQQSEELTSSDFALAKVFGERLEEFGLIAEVQYCDHVDSIGRRRCAIAGFSLPEGSDRLDLFIGVSKSPTEQQFLPAAELQDISGRAARFFDYAVKKDWERFSDSAEALEAARSIHS